jgi:hypothetical protein
MTPEQEIRAAAIQAAASFCAPIGYVQGGVIPNPEDLLFVADVFCGYIEDGWQRALEINATGAKDQDANAGRGTDDTAADVEKPSEPMDLLRDVELREQQPAGDAEVTFDPDPVTIPQAVPVATPEPAPTQAADTSANVIPIGGRGNGGQPQNETRLKIEKMRRKVAEQIVSEAQTAKAREHKDRLRERAEERGVSDFVMDIDGQLVAVGAYLASL